MNKDLMLNVWLAEYDKLKSEQSQRIGFRDNLLYVTLLVFGGVASFAVSKTANVNAFLLLPWTSLILGWTYLVNDEKISAIGRYIRLTLVEKVKKESGHEDLTALFGWEIAHRSDARRYRRKIEQLVIDEITFVLSGIVSLIAFWTISSSTSVAIYVLSGIELLLLLILGWEIVVYADLAQGR